MSIEYGWEKFYKAIDSCVSSEESLQKRVASAFIFNLTRLTAEDVPADVWGKLAALRERVSALPAVGNEGAIEATTSKMSDEEARKCLEEIVSMFSDVVEAYGVAMAEQERL